MKYQGNKNRWSKEITNAMNPTNTKKAVEKLFKVKA